MCYTISRDGRSGNWQSTATWVLQATDGTITAAGFVGVARPAGAAGTAYVDNFFVLAPVSTPPPTVAIVPQSGGTTLSGTVTFQANVSDRLPNFRPIFEEVATQSGIDWRLLAAIGYQESKWDPDAESSMGASGVMMLTSNTADSLGVEDRSDARESILAGAGTTPGTGS